jgi:hypothetical protein
VNPAIKKMKEDAIQLAREIYAAVAQERNEKIIETNDNNIANAFAIEVANELFALILSSALSDGRGQEITEDATKVYTKCRDATGPIIEKLMLEQGLHVLRVEIDKTNEPS